MQRISITNSVFMCGFIDQPNYLTAEQVDHHRRVQPAFIRRA
jgi:hypothetical protein